MPELNWTILIPSLIVAVFALLVLCIDIIWPRNQGMGGAYTALAGTVVALLACVRLWGIPEAVVGFGGMLVLDHFALFANVIFLTGTGLTIFISTGYLQREESHRSEYYLLLLMATLGMMLMAAGTDLIVIFLGLELMSISLYILVGFLRNRRISNEASLKYLLLGAFATGFLLYGIALIYGATGSTNLHRIGAVVSGQQDNGNLMLLAGMVLLIVGFAFKVSAAPFHMWAPDVYEGAPTAITAFISAGPKAAAFAAFLRVLTTSMDSLQMEWAPVLWVLAVLTMTVGNLGALSQQNIKRMLAYSSVAHAGYVLVALTAASAKGITAALFYMLAYTFMNIGAFAVIILVGRKGEENLDIASYAGLGFRRPALGLAMTLFMLSLAGLPPTAGFFGKFYIFSAAVEANLISLAVIGVLNSLISVYFYLGVVVSMYMKKPTEEATAFTLSGFARVALVITSVATLYIGLAPTRFLQLAQETVSSLM
ncbi:MAG: NADH-quinone oxidoreductase subunit N [bacterium]|nr:NADH-quinone oxidoreductase subunit N [bacterium]